jgi:hypothetical protein
MPSAGTSVYFGMSGSGISASGKEGFRPPLPSPHRQDRFSGRVDQSCGDKNDQVPFQMLIDLRTEQSPDERDVAEQRSLVLDLLHVFTNQTAEQTVWPSKMLTLVVTLRVLKIGWLMTFGVMMLVVVMPRGIGRSRLNRAAVVDEPSNSTTCGTRLRSMV